jgi:hypothetical protein
MERIANGEIDANDPAFEDTECKKRELLTGLAKDCGWIWIVVSILAALTLGPVYGRILNRFDYAYRDTKRSRALLGKKPTEVHPRYLPPKLEDSVETRTSIRSDLPPERRVRGTAPEEGILVGTDGEDKNYWVE